VLLLLTLMPVVTDEVLPLLLPGDPGVRKLSNRSTVPAAPVAKPALFAYVV
jgi:hypothetical protein